MESLEPTDLELIERFLNGSIESFQELITRYEVKVFNLAMRLTRNQEDAEEVLQDVFVSLYRRLSSFQGKSAFSSWLYRITVNASYMKLRKRKTDRTIPIDDQDLQSFVGFGFEIDYQARTDSRITSQELRVALEGAIDRLPDEYKAVFLLRDVDGLSNKEVGDILDLTIPAVKSRLHRSRLMLRRRLKRLYDVVRHDKEFIAAPTRALQHTWTAV